MIGIRLLVGVSLILAPLSYPGDRDCDRRALRADVMHIVDTRNEPAVVAARLEDFLNRTESDSVRRAATAAQIRLVRQQFEKLDAELRQADLSAVKLKDAKEQAGRILDAAVKTIALRMGCQAK